MPVKELFIWYTQSVCFSHNLRTSCKRCAARVFSFAVIEANASTLRLLESVQERMKNMTGDELSRFCLDNRLGGMSETLHFKVRNMRISL